MVNCKPESGRIEISNVTERGLFVMGKLSEEQKRRRRENKRKQRVSNAIERRLDSKNSFGITDPTPQQAVQNIIEAASKNHR